MDTLVLFSLCLLCFGFVDLEFSGLSFLINWQILAIIIFSLYLIESPIIYSFFKNLVILLLVLHLGWFLLLSLQVYWSFSSVFNLLLIPFSILFIIGIIFLIFRHSIFYFSKSLVMSPISFLILLVWLLSLFWFVSIAKSFSIF